MLLPSATSAAMTDTDLISYDPAKDPNFDPSQVEIITAPDWLLTHPDIVNRGIVVLSPLKSVRPVFHSGCLHTRIADVGTAQYGVYASETEPFCIVKIVQEGSSEARMYDILLSDLDNPANHTLPCEIIRSDPPLLIMPKVQSLCWVETAIQIFDAFYQILEVGNSHSSLSF